MQNNLHRNITMILLMGKQSSNFTTIIHNGSQLINGHFEVNVSFMMFIEDKKTLDNTMAYLQTFYEASRSKLQLAKTQCY
jgi:hypothetical protein